RAVTSFYNLKLQGIQVEREFPGESWQRQLERIARIPQPASGVRLIKGIALWKTRHSAEAEEVLRALGGTDSSNGKNASGDDALGVLMLARLAKAEDIIRAKSRINESTSFYLLTGLARQGGASESISEALRPAIAQAQPLVANIFP